MTEFIERLGDIVGEKGIVRNEEMSGRSAGYSHPDETLNAKVLVRPSNTDEVSRILKMLENSRELSRILRILEDPITFAVPRP